jgi:prevent-host-death family protein
MKTEREIPAAEFKAKCLKLMDEVAQRGRSFLVTKRGKPVARLGPVDEPAESFIGCAKGLVIEAAALTEPTGETWDAESA